MTLNSYFKSPSLFEEEIFLQAWTTKCWPDVYSLHFLEKNCLLPEFANEVPTKSMQQKRCWHNQNSFWSKHWSWSKLKHSLFYTNIVETEATRKATWNTGFPSEATWLKSLTRIVIAWNFLAFLKLISCLWVLQRNFFICSHYDMYKSGL